MSTKIPQLFVNWVMIPSACYSYHYYCGEIDMIQLKREALIHAISLLFGRNDGNLKGCRPEWILKE